MLDLQQLTELHNSMVKPLKRVKGFKSREDALGAISGVIHESVESLDDAELDRRWATHKEDSVATKAVKAASSTPETMAAPARKVRAPAKAKPAAKTKAASKPKTKAATKAKPVTKAVTKGKSGRAAEVPAETVVTVTVPDTIQCWRPGSKQLRKWERFIKLSPKERTIGAMRECGFTILDAQGAMRKGWITYKQ